MRTWVIGDIHGCAKELRALLAKLPSGDRMGFVGDFVHKGPDSKEVVRIVQKVAAFAVAGNHESNELRKPAQTEGNPHFQMSGDVLDPDQLDWIRGLPLFLRLEVAGKKFFIVHAGVNNSFYVKHPDGIPAESPISWMKGGGKRMDRMRRFTRMRYCNPEGEMLPLGEEKIENGDYFWATQYDGRDGHIIFGHEAFKGEPAIFPHATGIDTGCVYGDRLTAICLETGEFVQQDAFARYAERRMETDGE